MRYIQKKYVTRFIWLGGRQSCGCCFVKDGLFSYRELVWVYKKQRNVAQLQGPTFETSLNDSFIKACSCFVCWVLIGVSLSLSDRKLRGFRTSHEKTRKQKAGISIHSTYWYLNKLLFYLRCMWLEHVIGRGIVHFSINKIKSERKNTMCETCRRCYYDDMHDLLSNETTSKPWSWRGTERRWQTIDTS